MSLHLHLSRGTRALWLGAGLAVGVGCGNDAPDALQRIRSEGFLRAGYAQEPPYAFADPVGLVDGEAPSALRAALPTVGTDSVRWIRLDFEDLIPALERGRVDVVAAGLFVTPERAERVRFSVPTLCSRAAMAYRRGASPPAGIASFAGEGEGVLAVVEGSVESRAAYIVGVRPARLLEVPDLTTGLAAVRAGRAAAIALTAPTLRRAIAGDPALEWSPYEPQTEVASMVAGCSALAFRPGDERLAAAVDEALRPYLGSERHAHDLERLGFSMRAVSVPGASSTEGV